MPRPDFDPRFGRYSLSNRSRQRYRIDRHLGCVKGGQRDFGVKLRRTFRCRPGPQLT